MSAGLRAIFASERPMLLRLLTVRLGSREEAEDAIQDLWLKLDTLSAGPIADPSSYLFRMANNLALDRRRAIGRRTGREANWAGLQPGPLEQPGLERDILARERLAQVNAVLERLPERVSQAFRLYRFEELPRKKVAEHMGISVSAVEKHLAKAYQAIADVKLRLDEDRSTGRRLTAGILRHAP